MRIVCKLIKILIVEDNEGDVGLIEDVFEEAKIKNNIHVAEDGEEVVLYLRGEGKFSGSPRPDIIILDLNLPKKGAVDFFVKGQTEGRLLESIIQCSV